jgi:transposase
MGYIEGEDRNQIILFPESIDEYVSDNNSIRIIDEYINRLNLKSLLFKRAATPKMGRPPYHPKDMLKLYLYGYLNRMLPQPHPLLPKIRTGSHQKFRGHLVNPETKT